MWTHRYLRLYEKAMLTLIFERLQNTKFGLQINQSISFDEADTFHTYLPFNVT